jgi:hypothetical protein
MLKQSILFKEIEGGHTLKKRQVLSIFLIIIIYLLFILNSVDYNLFEFKLSMKSMLRQELTMEEMKNSNLYKAYKKINFNTNVEEINALLNKESRQLIGVFESWNYPYGYVSMRYSENEKPKVHNKIIKFETPRTVEINERELYAVFEYDSLEEINSILGEPVILGEDYNKDGKVTGYSYVWGIRTKYSRKFIEDVRKQYDHYVSLPWNDERRIGKFRLEASTKADNRIEGFSLDYYEE